MSRAVVTSLYCHKHLMSFVMLDPQRKLLMRTDVKRREIWEWSDHPPVREPSAARCRSDLLWRTGGHPSVLVPLAIMNATALSYGLCYSPCRHQRSSSHQGDGQPWCCDCTLQTTYDWASTRREPQFPAHLCTGHGACGSPCASRQIPWPCAARTTGRGCLLRCCTPMMPPVPGLRRAHGRTSVVFLR